MRWTAAVVCILGAYLAGSVPFGLLVGRLKGVDVRRHGSGNIGATNVGRVLGARYGLAVFAMDVLKGLVPVLLAGRILPTQPADPDRIAGLIFWVLVAAGAILGHTFPIYLGFRGGKGVATSLGALLGIYPYFTWPGLAVFGVWLLVTAVTRYVSLASVASAAAFPIIFALSSAAVGWGGVRTLWPLHVFSVAVALLVVYRHRGNLKRLRAGTEPKIGNPQPAPAVTKQG